MDVSKCENLSDIGFLCGLPFRELRASACTKAVTPEFISALRASKQLEVLDLSQCPGATNQALINLAAGCKALTHLALDECRNLSDAGLIAITKANPGIRHLSIAGNASGLTDAGVATALRNLRRLRVLHVEGCPALSDKTPNAVARYCEWIEELNLTKVKLGDDQLVRLVQNCPRLSTLILTGCTSLTKACLLDCLPAAPNLKSLNLSMMTEVTDSILAGLKGLCPGVAIERVAGRRAPPKDLGGPGMLKRGGKKKKKKGKADGGESTGKKKAKKKGKGK